MKSENLEVRQYSGSDAAMRSQMRTMHGHYLADAAAFAALNPDLGGRFGTDWLAAVEAADKAPNVDVRRGELREDTATVEEQMELARRTAQSVFYYVDQAFPKNTGRLSQYGKDRYQKAFNNADEMRLLLDMAATAAERDQAELAAKGFSAAQLAGLKALADSLDVADTSQEMRKGINQEGTGDYVQAQNRAYSFGQQLSKAAKVVFAQDASKQQLYRLNDTTQPQKEKVPSVLV